MAIKNKPLFIFVLLDILFLACAGVLVGLPIITRALTPGVPSLKNVAQTLLLDECPLTAAIANGFLMLATFTITLPAIFLKRNRTLLLVHSWLLIINAIFTLGVGLTVWFDTLRTKSNLAPLFERQPTLTQSMLQFKFQCCGYDTANTFVTDATCPNATVAAHKGLCVGPLSAFANSFLDIVFTSMFGICAIDGFVFLSTLCVLKDRAEKARYRLIDEKREVSNF